VDVRGRFPIDPDGVIQAMEVLPPEVGRSVGEVTPAGWEPGKPTLTPGPDLVGKVWEVWKPETAE
jgi:peroxiredoxin (alkyl hydroperoxide reductase subunit C)